MPDVQKREHKGELRLRAGRSQRVAKIAVIERAAAVAGDTGVAARADRPFRISVSSEVPVLRWDWYGDPYYEVLSHNEGDADLSRFVAGGAIRDQHWGDQVGSVANPALEDGECMVDAGFMSSQKGKDYEGGVREGHIQNVSLGYDTLDPAMPAGWGEDGVPIYRFRWAGYHVAMVPDPADYKVGFGRDAKDVAGERTVPVQTTGAQPREEQGMRFGPRMDGAAGDQPRGSGGGANPNNGEGGTRAATAANGGGGGVTVVEDNGARMLQQERERVSTIEYVCELGGIEPAQMRAWRDANMSASQVSIEIQKQRASKGHAQPSAEQLDGMRDEGLGLSERDAQRYSVARALRISASMFPGAASDGAVEFRREKFDGLEREVHDEVNTLVPTHMRRHPHGVFIPWRLRDVEKTGKASRERHRRRQMARAMGSTVSGGGAELVPEVMGELIELLRPQTVLYRGGARVISGLSAPVSYPVKTGALKGYWTSENPPVQIPFSEMKFGTRQLSPRTMGVRDVLPYQLIVQSSIDMESESRNDMTATIAEMLDFGGLHGPGTGGEPLGLFNTPGVQTSDDLAGVATFKDYLKIPGKSSTATKQNNLGQRSWLTSVEYASSLAGTPKESGFPLYLWPTDPGTIDESTLCGFPARSTTQIRTDLKRADGSGTADHHGLLFGPLNQCVYGLFGALQIIADPYSLAGYGQLAMTYLQLADFLCRYPEAFVKGDGAKPE